MSSYSRLLIDEPPLQVLPTLGVRIGLNAAIVIQQIHYWLTNIQRSAKKDDMHFFDGRWWTYNTYQEWHDNNFPFWSVKTIKRIFGALRERGLIECRLHEKRNDGVWVTIKYENLDTFCRKGSDQNDTTSDDEGSGQNDPTSDDDRSGQNDPTSEQGSGQNDPTGGQSDPHLRDSETSSETSSETFSAPAAQGGFSNSKAAQSDPLQDAYNSMAGEIAERAAKPEPTTATDLPTHGLTLYLSNATQLPVAKILTGKEVIKALTSEIKWSDPMFSHSAPSLVDQWDHAPGFQTYVKEYVPVLVRIQKSKAKGLNVKHILSFLANFGERGGNLPSFPQWRAMNPALCLDPNKASAPIERIGPVPDEGFEVF
ncbi:MAG: hypothetical protein JNM34_10865 [Chthonomonadaceae bacterium]|nr:hypothetical protein [Chthonomonadaceae bacterium]